MPNDIDSPDEIQRNKKWRSEFRGRLKKATDFLQGNQPIALTQMRHIEAFAQVLPPIQKGGREPDLLRI
jgi:hypothetical protein